MNYNEARDDVMAMDQLDFIKIQSSCLQCYDAVGLAAGRASGP